MAARTRESSCLSPENRVIAADLALSFRRSLKWIFLPYKCFLITFKYCQSSTFLVIFISVPINILSNVHLFSGCSSDWNDEMDCASALFKSRIVSMQPKWLLRILSMVWVCVHHLNLFFNIKTFFCKCQVSMQPMLMPVKSYRTQSTHWHPQFPHQCQCCTEAGGVSSSCQQVSQLFDCFTDALILTMFAYF